MTFRVVSASAIEQADKTQGSAAAWMAASVDDAHWQASSATEQVDAEEMALVMQVRAQEGISEMETALVKAMLAARARMETEYFMLIDSSFEFSQVVVGLGLRILELASAEKADIGI